MAEFPAGHRVTGLSTCCRRCIASGSRGRRVPGLIDRKLRAVWQADCRKEPPTLIGDISCHLDALAPQFGEGGLDVITHEVELVPALAVSWMNRELGRGQSEDEPASSRVCRRHAEHAGEERADLLSFRGEDDCMHTSDHAAILAARSGSPTPAAAAHLSRSQSPVRARQLLVASSVPAGMIGTWCLMPYRTRMLAWCAAVAGFSVVPVSPASVVAGDGR
jgi:hypothetical protein